MNIPVLIEPIPGKGYRAKGGEPFDAFGEGATPEDALSDLKQSVQRRLARGAWVVSVPVPASEHSWTPFAGMFSEEDPIVQRWLEILRSQRDDPETA